MKQLEIPLSDIEEAVLQLMQRVSRLEAENDKLREENKEMKLLLQEHD